MISSLLIAIIYLDIYFKEYALESLIPSDAPSNEVCKENARYFWHSLKISGRFILVIFPNFLNKVNKSINL